MCLHVTKLTMTWHLERVSYLAPVLTYDHIPANPQSTKTWRQPQKLSKWEPFLLADFFFFFFGFHFFQCNNSTLPTKIRT